jgi:hypothetical protein
MARRGNDSEEEARLKAILEQSGSQRNVASSVYPFVQNPVQQDPNKFYAPQNLYYYGDEYDDDEMFEGESPNAPADLTDVPTSTTNVSRPRTVAAGYDSNRRVLTVVFRDGTIWNYNGVTEGEWLNFKASISKGRPWINNQMFGRGEPADVSALDPQVNAALYTAARTAQLNYQTKRKYRGPSGKANVARLGKTGAVKAQRELRKRTPKKGGSNPSSGGKPPKR